MPAPADRMGEIAAAAVERLARKHQAREAALKSSREVIRLCANAIRAVHRHQMDDAQRLIAHAAAQVAEMRANLAAHPDLYFTGYAQDAQKEYAEACAVYAFIAQTPLPAPRDVGVEDAPYLNGLAEAASELRRYILDSLRRGDDARCEELMERMDEVYTLMVGVDFPDAVTGGLRRTTDQLRAVLERTRGDLTMTTRQRRLEALLRDPSSATARPGAKGAASGNREIGQSRRR